MGGDEDGTKWLDVSITPVIDDLGRVERLITDTRDVTDRKLAERAAVEDKERVQVTLDSLGDAVITTDGYGHINYLNPLAQELTGWPKQVAIGLPMEAILKVSEERAGVVCTNPISLYLDIGNSADTTSQLVLESRSGHSLPINIRVSPIRDRHGRLIGTVAIFHDVSKERRLHRQLSYQATHDALTGLINRLEFESRLASLLRDARENPERTHVLLYLDLDQFKVVNDTCGHRAGDEMLRQLTEIFCESVRSTDTVARLGGDEFGILLHDCSLEHAKDIGNTIMESVRGYRFSWLEVSFDVGVSIGVVEISSDCESLDSLLSHADVACYAAKEAGRNRQHVYSDGQAPERHREMRWVARITKAIREDRLQIFHQPIVALDTEASRKGHFELLLRMRDENDDLVSPALFIPAAERFNLMPAIDRWVVHRALTRLACRCGPAEDEAYTLSINLSGASLSDEDFLDFVKFELEAAALPAGAVCFEITETAAISNLSRVVHFMSELKAMGCLFSLDDFGSGLSSFAYLKNLPVDYLKIDGGFIRNITGDSVEYNMTDAINRVGRALGLKVIAEQVENEAVVQKLIEIGVEYAQGYFFGVPEPVEDAEALARHMRARNLMVAS